MPCFLNCKQGNTQPADQYVLRQAGLQRTHAIDHSIKLCSGILQPYEGQSGVLICSWLLWRHAGDTVLWNFTCVSVYIIFKKKKKREKPAVINYIIAFKYIDWPGGASVINLYS